ncbi:MAG TPA: universal stress protein [Noviherbaspirillum sp.]|uniref:universal stress protein n=1 Tax=Noviherbaspirillum sp. TaxID=1926288 RepID=UPI002B48E0EE|nr:universal stress protein [Noviherbaspirillum sp.]HJV85088.1 universal stress protein [Noviherbaspirillum sp.]
MSYKTVLVHVDKDKHAAERIEFAAGIAMSQEAHLIGAAPTGVSRFVYQSRYIYEGGGMTTHLENHIEELRKEAADSLTKFEETAKRMGVQSCEARAIDDEAGGGISLAARYSDLVVIGQTDREEPSTTTLPDFPEFVVMNSGRPVLIVPYVGHYKTVAKRVLIAWDASTSATRAITAAIPLLKHAENVDVVVFNAESKGDAHGEQPGADIGLYLARHGIKVNVVRQKTDIDVGNALLSICTDLGSDMIVMGGYGHSRFREILLGGVTRTVLESMTVPVFMSH